MTQPGNRINKREEEKKRKKEKLISIPAHGLWDALEFSPQGLKGQLHVWKKMRKWKMSRKKKKMRRRKIEETE